MLDVWVCANCHSINRERSTTCYKCGGPRTQSTGEGEGLRPVRAIQARLVTGHTNTTGLAILASILILIVVAFEVYITVLERASLNVVFAQLDVIAAGGAFDEAVWEQALATTDQLAIPSLIAFVAALLAFASWLSVTIGNIPGLGGGDPSVTRLGTFVWAVIPVVNLRRIPSIIQEVLYRLDPRGGGVFMVGLAWIGLVGSWIVARIVGLYLNTRLRFDALNADSLPAFATSSKQLLEGGFILDIVTTAMIAFGAVMLVAIILEVERRAAAREREIDATLGPPT